ncbi:hypothetical protein R1sor_017397 [Riccia sorocarpa]|uniref:Uncharacterized protein n=1 Tax=Riccia sorocarpa TaxID=122646 RepID=A0ABD3I6R1_9MARC
MRKVSKKDVCEEREFFYKEPYAKRIECILTKFDHEGFVEGKMLFARGQTICKLAFWTIYGFMKLYNYEGAFKMGQRVGFHGNHGTLKPKDETLKACMKTFFQQAAEPLPHKKKKKNRETPTNMGLFIINLHRWMRDNILLYQVKETYCGKWVPEHGRTLWKRQDPESSTNFNVQLPLDQTPMSNEMIAPYAKEMEVSSFIRNYIKHKEELHTGTDPNTNVFAEDEYLIQYWKNVADVIQAGWRFDEESEFQDAFWLITDYGTSHQVPSQTSTDPSNSMGNTCREAEEELQTRDEIFVGEAAARSLATFVPIIDVTDGLMLLLRPSDNFECQDCLLVAKATGPVSRDQSEPNFNKIPIQWWRPKHGTRKASILDRYT